MQMQGRQIVGHLVFKDRNDKSVFVERKENYRTSKLRSNISGLIICVLCNVGGLTFWGLLIGLLVAECAPQAVFAQNNGSEQSAANKPIVAEQVPGIPTQSLADYPAVGKSSGVWNDGLAALWDLHILDHYKYFGPAQRAEGYTPEQPINFSHIVHIQQNKMECQYCHWNVSKGSYAALPDVESCMGCHKLVGGHDEASSAEIEKLRKTYAEGKPIEWLKVHVMPDHYKFNHKRHVKGGVACHECHGQIPEMAKVGRVSSMKMGWCLDCHRMRGASIDCATCHY